ncbi:MAG: hypothetical protein ACLPZM_02985 [Thermoplasmata archaeon]
MTEAGPLGIPPGLLDRFRAAGGQVAWRPANGKSRKGVTVRVAHLFQEEARVETLDEPGGTVVRTDSGPVGALVLLLEADRRGVPRRWCAQSAGRDPQFPSGALLGVWGSTGDPPSDSAVRVGDLVELARYALA